jgi:putative transposase
VGIAAQTFHQLNKRFVGSEVDQVRQLKQLREENAKLKEQVAENSAPAI